MLLITCPWCGSATADRVPVRRARPGSPAKRPRRTHRRRVGRLALHARQPEGRISGSAGPTRPAVGAGSMQPATPSPTSSRREAGGGRDPDRPQSTSHFTFDGTEYEGFAGDTIASALLANDVAVVGRGMYTGRPRGIFTAGPKEPNALVQVDWPNGCVRPMLQATAVEIVEQAGAIHWRVAGGWWRTDNGRFDERYRHVEVLVVGGRRRRLGGHRSCRCGFGRVLHDPRRGPAVDPIAGVEVMTRSTAVGIYLTTATSSSPIVGRASKPRAPPPPVPAASCSRCRGAPARLPRQRPARDHARGLRGRVCQALRRPSGSAGRRLHHQRLGPQAARVLEAAGAEIVELADPRTSVQVTGTETAPAASLPCSSTGEGSKRICCWSPAAGIPTSL